ncbi:MAG: DUF2164 family protein [Lacunisphaera sp.]
MTFIASVVVGFFFTYVATFFLVALGRAFQLWRVLPERTVLVYTFFGKVVGQGGRTRAFLPDHALRPEGAALSVLRQGLHGPHRHPAGLPAQPAGQFEEGAPMGVGIWFEMFVRDPKAYLFQNSDPLGSLKANVATAIVKQLSNLKLDVLLENRDALSRKVREEVTPTSAQWGFGLGSTYIRKVAFRDRGMINEIQRKVVNRLRQGHRRDAAGRRERGRDHPFRSRQKGIPAPRPGPGRASAGRRRGPRSDPAAARSRHRPLRAARHPVHAEEPRQDHPRHGRRVARAAAEQLTSIHANSGEGLATEATKGANPVSGSFFATSALFVAKNPVVRTPDRNQSLCMIIELTPVDLEQSSPSLQKFFREEFEQELSEMKARFLLEYFLKEVGPVRVYKRA